MRTASADSPSLSQRDRSGCYHRSFETMLEEGSIFAGRYRVERAIAKGGMGVVYEVVHVETERTRALKVLHENALDSAELRERFRREARVTSKIESEFIVEVFDAGIDEETNVPFLVMELLRGEELGQRLKRAGAFSASETVIYLSQAAMALDKTHAASIVHRDLKPANLFLTQRDDGSPRIKILDFGIAKLIAEGETQGGTKSLGTPLYMAPEQFRAGGRVSAAADIYALGLIAYTLLTGRPYWEEERKKSENLIAFAFEMVNGPVEAPSERASRRGIALSKAFDAWFARAAAGAADQRFETAGEAIAALAQALGVAAPPSLRAFTPGALAERPIEITVDEVSAATRISHAEARNSRDEVTATEAAVTQPFTGKSRRSMAAALVIGGVAAVGIGATVAVNLLQAPGSSKGHAQPSAAQSVDVGGPRRNAPTDAVDSAAAATASATVVPSSATSATSATVVPSGATIGSASEPKARPKHEASARPIATAAAAPPPPPPPPAPAKTPTGTLYGRD
jgi:serine/threonine-protein kinase